MIYRTIVIFFMLAGSCYAEISQREAALLLCNSQLLFADHQQTQDIRRDPIKHETNLILGDYPSRTDISLYFIGVGLLEVMVVNYFDDDHSEAVLNVVNSVQLLCIDHNARNGLDPIGLNWYVSYTKTF